LALVKNHGPCVYFDTSCKKPGGKKRHNCWRADITVNDRRCRIRGKNKELLMEWLDDMKETGK
jgi:hypothetical protein